MPRRLTLSFAVSLSLAAALGAGCSRSGDSKSNSSVPGTRPLAAIWADVLGQRDVLHLAFIKDLDAVTHQDCAEVGASARRMDALTTELVNHVGGTSGQGDSRLRALGEAITRMGQVFARVRESAIAESPGAWAALRFPVDLSLRDVESYFTADELGSESVMNRPGFETKPLAAPLSPI